MTYKVQYPLKKIISYDSISKQHKVFLISISKEQEPIQYHDATKNINWFKAIREELNALKK
jgi:hypothetical protein